MGACSSVVEQRSYKSRVPGSIPGTPTSHARLAQRLEHLVYTERAGGSNPSARTMEKKTANELFAGPSFEVRLEKQRQKENEDAIEEILKQNPQLQTASLSLEVLLDEIYEIADLIADENKRKSVLYYIGLLEEHGARFVKSPLIRNTIDRALQKK